MASTRSQSVPTVLAAMTPRRRSRPTARTQPSAPSHTHARAADQHDAHATSADRRQRTVGAALRNDCVTLNRGSVNCARACHGTRPPEPQSGRHHRPMLWRRSPSHLAEKVAADNVLVKHTQAEHGATNLIRAHNAGGARPSRAHAARTPAGSAGTRAVVGRARAWNAVVQGELGVPFRVEVVLDDRGAHGLARVRVHQHQLRERVARACPPPPAPFPHYGWF